MSAVGGIGESLGTFFKDLLHSSSSSSISGLDDDDIESSSERHLPVFPTHSSPGNSLTPFPAAYQHRRLTISKSAGIYETSPSFNLSRKNSIASSIDGQHHGLINAFSLDTNKERFSKYGKLSSAPYSSTGRKESSSSCNEVDLTVKGIERKDNTSLGAIQPDLYKLQISEKTLESGEFAENDSNNNDSPGTVTFSMRYSHAETKLHLTIKRAHFTNRTNGTLEPYIKLCLLPDRKHRLQTKVNECKMTCAEFNEMFSFHVQFRDLTSKVLLLSVYNFEKNTSHFCIGKLRFKNLLCEGDLATEQYFTKPLVPVDEERDDLGEIMFSLCYLPSAGRLTVSILKAINLKAMDVNGVSDPYVKVSLWQQNKRLKKKKTGVRKNTLNPSFNESMVFDISPDQMYSISLLIQVMDYDRIGHSSLIGYVEMDAQQRGSCRTHWNEMMQSPRKPVTFWHNLINIPHPNIRTSTKNSKSNSVS